jgi:3-hydroxyacyl-CoA dehydrogenase
MKYKVGIVGFGFVGESQAFAFALVADVKIYDMDSTKATHTLEAAWKTNLRVRPEKDWEQLIGRAITKSIIK